MKNWILTIKYYLNKLDKIVTVSKAQEYILNANGVNNTYTINNGISAYSESIDFDKVRAFRDKYDIRSDEKVIMWAGRLSKAKGLNQVLIIINRLIEHNYRFRLLVVGGDIINDNHLFTDTEIPYNGLYLADGDEAIVRDVSVSGFSGTAHHFDCPVEVKYLRSSHDNAGIYFGKASTAHSCFIQWLRQIQGQSFGYWVKESLEITNSGCNLDETGGLGVFCIEEGATLTINGGDYQFRIPLPFLTAIGNCTVVLNNVMMNGVLYNETIELSEGESWRGEKAEVTVDTLKVYANKTLNLPYMHIPQLDDAIAVQGTERPFNTVVTLPSGARILATQDGSLRYMPDEAWLHLDPSETAIDFFRYSTEDFINY